MLVKEIEAALEEGNTLKAITEAYSEIANLKVKRIRSAVERNRLFFDEISKVYGIVKAFAIQKKVAVNKPKKRLCILLTSNEKFYGSINLSLINFFIGSTRELPDVDKIILGKGGIDYFRTIKVLPNYQEIVLREDMPTNQELMQLVQIVANYNQVLVFYPRLKSLLAQEATFTDITALSLYLRDFHTKSLRIKNEGFVRFIFEPDLPKILQFFDSQILTLLLEGTFLESELSRTASRFISMDAAQSRANKFIEEYKQLKAYAKRSLINRQILENFASMMAVRKDMT